MTIPLAVNHESEVTTWSSSIKDLERQQDRLARVSILPSPTSSPHTGNMAISLYWWWHDLISSRHCFPYKAGRGLWNKRITKQEVPSAHHR